MNFSVIIVAGGSGLRMNSDIPKQFLELSGIPVLMHTVNAFYKYDPTISIIVVLPEHQIAYWKELCRKYSFNINHKIAQGGDSRFQSVKNGLEYITKGLVAIHDGVRPLVSSKTISKAFELAEKDGNAIPTIDIDESLRFQLGNSNSVIDRENVKVIQTPQVFHSDKIKNAYDQEYDVKFTDDACVLESAGERIYLSPGNKENIKITSPSDLIIAEAMLKLFED